MNDENKVTSTLLTLTEAAKFLRMKTVWLRRTAKKGGVPYIKIGRRLYFNREDLRQWLHERKK